MKANSYAWIILFSMVSCQKSATENSVKTDTLLQKSGVVLRFHPFEKSLIRLKRDNTIYAENYQKRIGKLVEYYLDKTKNGDVKFQLENHNAKLGFSLEETDWEGVKYTQIGLFNKPNESITTFIWLFYNPKTQELYEFDVPENKPILFKL